VRQNDNGCEQRGPNSGKQSPRWLIKIAVQKGTSRKKMPLFSQIEVEKIEGPGKDGGIRTGASKRLRGKEKRGDAEVEHADEGKALVFKVTGTRRKRQ